MTWRLIQTDPYAYALQDMLGNPIAEISFYPELLELFDDTKFGTNADRKNNHRVATLAAAAPELLNALKHYATHGDRKGTRELITAILTRLNNMPDEPGWGPL